MKLIAIPIFASLVACSTAVAQPSWQNTAFHAPPAATGFGMGYHMALADTNGDGVLDIVASAPYIGFQGGGIVLLGPDFTQTLMFSIPTIPQASYLGAWAWAAGDVNGDGKADVVAGSAINSSGRAYVLFGPSFTQSIELQTPYQPGQNFGWKAALMDYTGDGVDDVLVSAPFSGEFGRIDVFSCLNGCAGPPAVSIEPVVTSNMLDDQFSHWGNGILTEDLDGDGLRDILVPQKAYGPPLEFLAYLRGGNPGDVVLIHKAIPLWVELTENFLFADIDGDGKKDLLSRARNYNIGPGIMYSTGSSLDLTHVVTETTPNTSGDFGRVFDVGDVDRDGHPDLVASDAIADYPGLNGYHAGRMTVFFGPDFVKRTTFVGIASEGYRGAAIIVRDFDHDGFCEILFSGPYESGGSIYRLKHITLRAGIATPVSIAVGAAVPLSMECGKLSANANYAILVSASGSSPGLDIPSPGGPIHLPLVLDPVTTLALGFLNTPLLDHFQGQLDAEGNTVATFNLPPQLLPPAAAGLGLTFAGITYNGAGAITYATHAATIALAP